MPPTSPTSDETRRVETLSRYQILDTPPENAFDRLTRLAARMLGVPTALIGLADSHRMWFKARYGFDPLELPLENTFCRHVVASERMLVVPDALNDPRFADNPLVACEDGIRFYAGTPLTSRDGCVFGTFCAIDVMPRSFSEDDRAVLNDFARIASDQIELRAAALLVQENDRKLKLFEQIVEQANDIVLVTEADTIDRPGPRIVYVNRAFEQQSGYSRLEAIGVNPRFLQGPRSPREPLKRIRRALENREPITVEVLNYRKDGSEYWAEIAISPVLNQNSTPTHFVAIQRDLTERKYIEARLQHLQKMETVGLFAGGIAHNFNNLLTIINGYCEILLTKLPADSREHRKVEAIRTAAKRGAELVRQLSRFNHTAASDAPVLDINECLKESKGLVEGLIGSHIQVITDIGQAIPEAMITEWDFIQILLNIVANARDAMPDGGTLTLATGSEELSAGEVARRFPTDSWNVVHSHRLVPGQYIVLTIADTGSGMDRTVLKRLFEPFFTTKPVDQGTGLGLATVYGIVIAANGMIAVQSEPGRGTTFRLYFPARATAEKS